MELFFSLFALIVLLFPPFACCGAMIGNGAGGAPRFAQIACSDIMRDPAQPRQHFDEDGLQELAASLKSQGQQQPIRVRPDVMPGKYIIIDGERRWRAAQIAGLATLDAVIIEGEIDEIALLDAQMVANIHRADFRPIEEARSYQRRMKLSGCSAGELAQTLGFKGASRITKSLALLDNPPDVQEMIENGQIPPSAGYDISRLPDDRTRREFAQMFVARSMTRDQLSQAVKEKLGKPSNGKKKSSTVKMKTASITINSDADAEELVTELASVLKKARAAVKDGADIQGLLEELS